MMGRIRVIQFVIQPVLVLDDGVHLAPQQCEPITVPASALDDFPAWWAQHLASSQPVAEAPADPEEQVHAD